MLRNWLKTGVIATDGDFTDYLAISKAVQRDFAKPIIIKSVRLGMLISPLQTEERVLKSCISVPEIIQSHGHQITREDNGMHMFNLFLEYPPLGNLTQLMIKNGPFLESKKTKVYISMLLRGLSWIHKKGIVHCDFTPNNIFVFPLDQDGDNQIYQLKIAGFGSAKIPEENSNPELWTWKFRGTPMYTSPESFASGLIETPLDIWSFGCVVIEMITRRRVWGNEITSESDIKLKLGILQEPPTLPNGLSERCLDFLSKCFVVDPKQRWTADMLLNHSFLIF